LSTWDFGGFFAFLIAILFQFTFIVSKDYQDACPSNKEITAKIPRGMEVEKNPDALKEKTRLLDSENKDMVKIVQGYRFYPDGSRALWDLNFGVDKLS